MSIAVRSGPVVTLSVVGALRKKDDALAAKACKQNRKSRRYITLYIRSVPFMIRLLTIPEQRANINAVQSVIKCEGNEDSTDPSML